MKIVNGTAIYTGGGCYSVIGKLDNGLYFNGCNDWCAAFDEDTRTVDKETGDLACFDNAWCEEHEVKVNQKELYKAFKDFCERLDSGEPGITMGYEKFSNYSEGEVTNYIDFEGFGDLLEDNKMNDVKKIVNRILEGADIRSTLAETNYKSSDEDYNAVKNSKELDALWSTYNKLIRNFTENNDEIEDVETSVVLNPDCTLDLSAEISGEGFTKQYFNVAGFKAFLSDVSPDFNNAVDVKKAPGGGIRVKNKHFTSLLGFIKVLTEWFTDALTF